MAVPPHGYLPTSEPEQGWSAPSLPSHCQHPPGSVLSPCTHWEGGRPDSSSTSPHPGNGGQLLPGALGHATKLAPGTAPLLQGKHPNKSAHGFPLLPLLPNPKLKRDFSNHKVPPGGELRAGSFERCPRHESRSLSSSPPNTSGVTTLGMVRSPSTAPGSSLGPWEPHLQRLLSTASLMMAD